MCNKGISRRSCYCKYEFFLSLTAYLALIILGVTLFTVGTSNNYGDVIIYETKHWDQKVIVNMIGVNTSCPDDYEQVYGKFYGTYDAC